MFKNKMQKLKSQKPNFRNLKHRPPIQSKNVLDKPEKRWKTQLIFNSGSESMNSTTLFLDQVYNIDGVELTGAEIKEALIDNAIYKKIIGDSEW